MSRLNGQLRNISESVVQRASNIERTLPKITQEDLKDATLSRLNGVLDLIARQLTATQGGTGPTKFMDAITAPDVKISRRGEVSEDNQALTFGEAKRMFSIPAINTAIIQRQQFGIPVASFVSTGDQNTTIYDTHAARSGYVASEHKGWMYYESDRTVAYVSMDAGAGSFEWVYVGGIYTAIKASIPADLGVYDKGFMFDASDWKVKWKWSGSAFVYYSGIYQEVIANKPTLTVNDVGFLFEATDYKHLYRWTGTVWEWGPGEAGSGWIVASTGSAPAIGLWAVCDGTSTTIALSNATTAGAGLPPLGGNVFIQGGSYTGSVDLAAYATWETTAKTDNESTHTHPVDPPSTASSTDGSHDHSYSATTGTNSSSQEVASGTGVTVAANGHSHSDSGTTGAGGSHNHSTDIASFDSGAGAAHSHVLSNGTALLKKFSEANGGLPDRVKLAWFMRR